MAISGVCGICSQKLVPRGTIEIPGNPRPEPMYY